MVPLELMNFLAFSIVQFGKLKIDVIVNMGHSGTFYTNRKIRCHRHIDSYAKDR